ncbi:hypothetical protein Tco_0843511 [Tanacetum coccineum]
MVDSKRVHDMFGIPVGGTPLLSLEETEGDVLTNWLAQFDLDPKKIRVTNIAELIVKATNIDFMLKMNFLLLVTNTLAKNETKNGDVSLDVLKRIREDFLVQSIDWCGYILDSHKNSTNSKGVDHFYNGPVFFLRVVL